MKAILLMLGFSVVAFPVLAQAFFLNLPDIPVMPGLVEIEERGLRYDKPEGRILFAAAKIDDSIDDSEIERFYSNALPQFGWVLVKPFIYVRGQERLAFSIQQDVNKKILEVQISP